MAIFHLGVSRDKELRKAANNPANPILVFGLVNILPSKN
jgi:hypothetical protein